MGLGTGKGGWACSGGGLWGGWWRVGNVGGGGVLCFRNGKEWSRNEVMFDVGACCAITFCLSFMTLWAPTVF